MSRTEKQLMELLQEAELTTNRKEALALIHEAEKLRSQIRAEAGQRKTKESQQSPEPS